ncbi:hypothetical protein [Microbacterium sp. MPKO10]|uniref:hypothetical protein n=1 Tax=Microbacterium sp. MPKO10 TaxID=2989818 RepID=UPI0022361A1D|nr:hypothetical protein [Microbacterium sp. MPKO10]MCW4459973.1 hypothetical protein [Microbacterium sp. MPKO10]
MSHRYIYTTQVGTRADTNDPGRPWGLYFADDELTEDAARARYALEPQDRQNGFIGIVRVEDGEERPSAYLQMGPRANGARLHNLGPHGVIQVSYTWDAYHEPPRASDPYEGDASQVFLGSIVWFTYPDENQFWRQSKNVGSVMYDFRENGYARADESVRGGFGNPDEVTTREFENVDVSANWFDIPEFGDWEAFFHPEGDEEE